VRKKSIASVRVGRRQVEPDKPTHVPGVDPFDPKMPKLTPA
jgi:hypothetical protein